LHACTRPIIELVAAAERTEEEPVDELAPDLVDQEAGLEDELADLFAEQATA